MSREIKFRAWDRGNAQMVNFEDIYIELEDGCLSVFKLVKNGFGLKDHHELDVSENNVILMQYTGLKDKNGVEIYEGDVVRLKDYHGERIVEISFHNGVYYYAGDRFSDEYLFNSHEREVIGNIYENPDLLNG